MGTNWSKPYSYFWGDNMPTKLTSTQKDKISKLINLAKQQEQKWAQDCAKLLNEPYDPTNDSASYIKRFFGQMKTTKADDFSSTMLLTETLRMIRQDLVWNKKIVTGMQAMAQKTIKDYFENEGKVQHNFTLGDYNETDITYAIRDILYSRLPKGSFKIHNTDNYKEGIRYDIDIFFKSGILSDKSHHMYIEAKTGITNDPLSTHFKLGQFSSAGLSRGRVQYKDLIEALQRDFYNYVYMRNTQSPTSPRFDLLLKRIAIDMAIEYIIWRLNNYFPIFIGSVYSGQPSILLCSEILEGFRTKPGGYVDLTIDDFLYVIGLDSKNQFKTRGSYTSDLTQWTAMIPNEYGEESVYSQFNSYIKTKWFNHNQVDIKSTANYMLEQGVKITPRFKASVHYGYRTF